MRGTVFVSYRLRTQQLDGTTSNRDSWLAQICSFLIIWNLELGVSRILISVPRMWSRPPGMGNPLDTSLGDRSDIRAMATPHTLMVNWASDQRQRLDSLRQVLLSACYRMLSDTPIQTSLILNLNAIPSHSEQEWGDEVCAIWNCLLYQVLRGCHRSLQT